MINELSEKISNRLLRKKIIDNEEKEIELEFDELQKQFENEFPYQLTSDQQAAVDAIKKDMESN